MDYLLSKCTVALISWELLMRDKFYFCEILLFDTYVNIYHKCKAK